MDYYEQNNGASGSIPEFGAIFMSNTETQSECFDKKIFALPYSRVEFVKHIKAGMILFLFEYKKRQLYGVYQAFSDGAIDIAPHAFKYSGRHFPAQVCFTRIWHCDPLPETEFRDAIKENYFSAKKFNFGLSEVQVRRLLYMFSSRKLKSKMPPRPLPETVVEVASKNRRLVRDDISDLSARGYMEPADYDAFSPVPFFNHSSTQTKEEALVDDGFNTEGQLHPYLEDEFLSKKRRLGNNDRSITNDEAENGIYYRGAPRVFHSDFLKDSLDELKRLANNRRLLLVDMVDENIVDRHEDLVDPLDAIVNDNYRILQRRRLIDEYNLQNSSKQAFASDHYDEFLDKFSRAVDDTFLLDDSMQRDYNPYVTLKPVGFGDSNQSLYGQARELIDDQESLMNRKSEDRPRLGRDGTPIGAFEHSSSPLHKIRGTAVARRLPVNDREPDFGTSSVDKISHPLQYGGHRIVYDRNYPAVEGILNENLVDNNFRSTSLAKSDVYFTGVDRQVVDDERFRKSERADNEVDSRMHTNPAMPKEYRSFSPLKQNLSSFPGRLPEKGLSHSTSRNFNLSRSTFDDATITRAVPYPPDHPSYSRGFSASIPANQNPSLVRKGHPDHGLGNFYPPSKKRSPQYFLESEKFSRPLGIAPEFVHECFPTSTSGHQSTLHHEPTSSFPNSNLPVHMDLKTSAPHNYLGSLFPKLSPQHSGILKSEGEQGLLAYSPKSRENSVHMDWNTSAPANNRGSFLSKPSPHNAVLENFEEQRKCPYPSELRDDHFAFDKNLTFPLHDTNKHEMDLSGGQNYSIHHPERDLACLDSRYMRSSSNMNLQEPCKVSEAPNTNSNVSRKSVFSRLTSSKVGSVFGKERNDTSFSHDDRYMDASADEIMKMVQLGGSQSQIKLSESRSGENAVNEKQQENAVNEKKQEKAVNEKKQENAVKEKKQENAVKEKKQENAVKEKKTQNHIETNHSTMEMNELNDEILSIAHGIDEVPSETRFLNFKRRSERQKILVRTTADSDTHNTITSADVEVKCSTKPTLKRRKLIRPSWDKAESAIGAMCKNGASQNHPPILRKDDEQSCEAAHRSGAICKNRASQNHPPILGKDDTQSCEAAHTPSAICKNEASQNHPPILGKDDTQSCEAAHPPSAICKNGASQNHPPILGKDDIQSSEAAHQPVDCNKNEHQSREQQKDDVEAHVLPSTIVDLKGHETATVDLQIASLQALKETIQQKSSPIQITSEGILVENTDTTTTNLNLPESSLEGSRPDAGCANNPVQAKSQKTKKRKKKSKKTLTTGM